MQITASLRYSLINNFSCGSIARAPLCCQQRTGPWTRREHGVPFFVNAPHRYTFCSSDAESGGCMLSLRPNRAGPGSSGLVKGDSALRIMVNGDGAGVRARPATYPAPPSAATATSHGRNRSFRSCRLQPSQNLRLVQKCHVSRNTFCPHCAQKFGRYMTSQ